MILACIFACTFLGILGGIPIGQAIARNRPRLRRTGTSAWPIEGKGAIELDCHACGQFNRVPEKHLRDRPVCGACKARLRPKAHLVVVRGAPPNLALNAKLRETWQDPDRLWSSLADYLDPVTPKAS